MSKNLYIVTLLFVLGTYFCCTAQTTIQTSTQADSLRQVIASTKHDTLRIQAMNDLAEYYGRILSRFDSSLAWARRAEELSSKVGNSHGLAIATSVIGATYLFRGRASEAQEYFYRALRIAEENKDKQALVMTWNFLGLLFEGQERYSEALEYFSKTLTVAKEVDDKKSIVLSLSNIGETYLRQRQYHRALEYLLKALPIKNEQGDKVATANVLYAIGGAYCKLEQYSLAEEYCKKSLHLAEQVSAPREMSGALTTLAMIYCTQGKYAQSLANGRRALALADSIGLGGGLTGETGDALKTLSVSCDSLDKHKDAFAYYRRYITIRDSLQNITTIAKTSRLQEEYENEKKLKFQQMEQQRQALLRNFFFVGFGVVSIVAVTLGGLYRQKKKANEEILRQQRVLEDQATEIELTNTALQEAHEQSESLLLNILPAPIALRLKSGERAIADKFDSVTVLFADIVGFTKLSAHTTPEELVQGLNAIFERFDALAKKYGLEKIKTIGDAYMVAGGLPERSDDHCERAALFALEIQTAMREKTLRTSTGEKVELRIGLHTGEAVAGVIGTSKFAYDIWGDTVNTASRMESHGDAGKIHVSEEVFATLHGKFVFEERGEIDIKGKGRMKTYFLTA